MSGARIEVRPYAGALGAEVSGVDLARSLDGVSFAARFGPLNSHPFLAGVAGDPAVLELRREPDTRFCFSDWHSDLTYMERPLLGAILYAREVPAAGGDTQFAKMYLAYEALSVGMKALCGGFVAVHAANVDAYRGDPTREASEA